MPIGYLGLPGNFIIAALLTGTFTLSAGAYGLIASLPFWCNFLQIFLTPLLALRWHAKAVTIGTAWAHFVCWLALAVTFVWFPRDNPSAGAALFFGFFLVIGLLSAINGVSWNVWTQEWSPERLRGKYFGGRNRLLQISTVLFLVVVGAVLDRLDNSLRAFQFLFLCALALRVASIFAQQKMQTGGAPDRAALRPDWSRQFAVIARSRSLLVFIAFGAVWGFASNCFGPFYAVFMYQQLRLSVSAVSLFVILSGVGAAVSFPAWGQLCDRFGNVPVMAVSLILWQAQNYLWCVLTPANTGLLYFMWAWAGVTSAGFALGQFNILLKLIPAEAKTTAIGLNVAVTSLITAIAPIIGGAVLSWAFARGYDPALVYRRAFLVQPTLALLGCFLLMRVREPKASALGAVFGAMRNIRTLGALVGLTFLVNYVFVPPPRRRNK